ncbi:hypothetical protein ASE14_11300 [Agromyces sp. Root81]|uniref:hypothetical protein n=1 Tax=Agromyces sp. Root81 TaxID=1736601 RepID=UPI0006F5D7FD|nr:hypothetical protein [Agromyces sp. Root81]KRC61448.1 hypothetical protein ASE14_11300 [Agromyces sp. Root81]
MSKPSSEVTVGHVVHLIERFDAADRAPESLLLPKRMRTLGRVMFALAGLVATAGAVAALVMLWTDETPGWWFNVIFTVMIGGIPVVLWAILIGSIQDAGAERAMQEVWQEHRHHARAERGSVADRRIALSDDGSVSSFDLVVTLGTGGTLEGSWRPRTSSSRPLLQTQVPGVGTAVRVWRIADAGVDPSASPVVIEVTDPTVVVQQRG